MTSNGPKIKPFIKRVEKIFQLVKNLKSKQVLPKKRQSSPKFEKPYQTISFPNGHQAQLLKVSPDAEPKSAVLKKFEFGSPEGLIMVAGDTQNLEESIQQRLKQLMSRGLAKTAVNLNAVLMDNGKTSDLVTLTGQSVADRKYKVPLIGVAAAPQVSYPGQSEAETTVTETTPLDPNHTHFVLVDTDNDHQVRDCRFQLGTALAHKSAVLLLVNGGEEARTEVLQAVRAGWSIITLTGTGQLADDIADLTTNPPDFIPDSDLAEIIADGKIIPFPIDSELDEFERLLYNQFHGDNTLKLAWQQFALYDKNATRQQNGFYRLQGWILICALLGTVVALFQASLDLQLQQAKTISVNRFTVEKACKVEALNKLMKAYKQDDNEVDDFCWRVNNKVKNKVNNEDNHLFTLFFGWLNEKDITHPEQAYDKEKQSELWTKEVSMEEKKSLRQILKIYDEANELVQFLSKPKHQELTEYLGYLVSFLQEMIVAIPIILTVLIGVSNRFSRGQKWIWLRSSAETLKSEIFRYRAKVGVYGVGRDRETKLAAKIQSLNQHLTQSEVSLSALKPYHGPLPPQYSTAAQDDGLTLLSPERYLNLRLEDQLHYYQHKTTQLERRWTFLQWGIYGLGGVGTLLAARNLELWIALTTGLVSALTSYLGYQQIEERLKKYNQASFSLTNILNWWSALSLTEKAKPENIGRLVSDTEEALGSEFEEWTQKMQETLKGLKEKNKKLEKASQKMSQKYSDSKREKTAQTMGEKELASASLEVQSPKDK